MAAILMVVALAAKKGRFVVCLDIGGTYLNAKLQENEVFMLLDSVLSGILIQILPQFADFVDEKGRLTVRLRKAIPQGRSCTLLRVVALTAV